MCVCVNCYLKLGDQKLVYFLSSSNQCAALSNWKRFIQLIDKCVSDEHPVTQKDKLVSAVADGPRNTDLCMLKSYQLLHDTQLPQTECAVTVSQSMDSYCRPILNCMPCVYRTDG